MGRSYNPEFFYRIFYRTGQKRSSQSSINRYIGIV